VAVGQQTKIVVRMHKMLECVEYSLHLDHKEDNIQDEGGLVSVACPLSSSDFE